MKEIMLAYKKVIDSPQIVHLVFANTQAEMTEEKVTLPVCVHIA